MDKIETSALHWDCDRVEQSPDRTPETMVLDMGQGSREQYFPLQNPVPEAAASE